MSITDTECLNNLPILFDSLNLENLNEDARIAIAAIDAVLPQTQCGLCGHHDGCLPYAHGIVMHGEAINLCVPGGQAVSDQIANITKQPKKPATPSKWATNPNTQRPIEVRAIIDEANCIGCTKCIPACPVDAIIGSAKQMHSIITDLCTGCELCLPACPVDCIDLSPHARTIDNNKRQHEEQHLRNRYHQHLHRVAKTIKTGSKPVVSTIESAMVNALNSSQSANIDETAAKNTIAAAKLRNKIKKITKQLALANNPSLQTTLEQLTQELAKLEKAAHSTPPNKDTHG